MAMKRVAIVGLGNILHGDLGIGCYIVEALAQEMLDDCIELFYLGEECVCAGAYIHCM